MVRRQLLLGKFSFVAYFGVLLVIGHHLELTSVIATARSHPHEVVLWVLARDFSWAI